MINVLFAALDVRWDSYEAPLRAAFTARGLEVNLHRDQSQPDAIDYIIYAPNGPLQDFTPYANTKAVLSLWAGVERLMENPTLTQPATRMVDAGLSEGMVEWVTGHVLRHHLGIDAQLAAQNGDWSPVIPPLARNRAVGILGMGALGQACAKALRNLNFKVSGWSRTPKTINGVTCHSGADGLEEILSTSEILVLLLPQTPATENTLNAVTLAQMPKGAVILNPGRGPLIDDEALLDALNSGQIAQATLDVFRIEPLPKDHPFWAHPKVTVTPHIASETRPETAAIEIAENIWRSETGQPLQHLVNREIGY